MFQFDIITIDTQGQEISRRQGQAEIIAQDLGNGVLLEMVSIPGGTFMMGSPESEDRRFDEEGPQRQVTVAPFYMGKYLVTQAQWQAVANMPKVKRNLDPNPAKFKGELRPVDTVTWSDAVEFCARLSKQTGKEYRLPSEAEWEYACRAGTETPFHFGPTLTTDLANYNGKYKYSQGPTGEDRQETTNVGILPPNAFGLYDMHGNLREWCADPWHKNYEGAPTDGKVWEKGGDRNQRAIRNGGWRQTISGWRRAGGSAASS